MAPKLPAEIWIRIVSFVSDADLSSIYAVDRMFYDLAATARYGELCVSPLLSNQSITRIEGLSLSPSLARHIRTFKVDLCAFETPKRPYVYGSTRLEPTADLIRRTVGRLKRKDPHHQTAKPAHEVFDVLLALAMNMGNVHHCSINMCTHRDKDDHSSYPQDHIQFLRHLWSILSERVQSLSLSSLIPWEMATLTQIFMAPRLTHVSLHLSFDYPNSWGTSGLANLAHFLHHFKETLRSVRIIAFHGLSIAQWRDAFDDLDYFPQLQQIELCLKVDEIVGRSVFAFLDRHGDHITELSIGQVYPGVPNLHTLRLPSLRRLRLDVDCASSGRLHDFWTSPINFNALTSLSLVAPSLSSTGLSAFCKNCRESGYGHQLRDLALSMHLLNGGVFDSLSVAFPLLHSLSISYRVLSNADGSGIWTTIGFVQQMEPRLYPQWELYDMMIIQIQEDFFEPATIMYTLMKAIVQSIPSVKSFCGSGHLDFSESRVPIFSDDLSHW